jgi:hypothetical protein
LDFVDLVLTKAINRNQSYPQPPSLSAARRKNKSAWAIQSFDEVITLHFNLAYLRHTFLTYPYVPPGIADAEAEGSLVESAASKDLPTSLQSGFYVINGHCLKEIANSAVSLTSLRVLRILFVSYTLGFFLFPVSMLSP